MRDLAERLTNRVQLTTDALQVYKTAVEAAFKWDGCDFAQLHKVFSQPIESDRKYSPPVVTGTEAKWVMGKPKEEDVCTSHVERQNLTHDPHAVAPLYPPDERVQQKARV